MQSPLKGRFGFRWDSERDKVISKGGTCSNDWTEETTFNYVQLNVGSKLNDMPHQIISSECKLGWSKVNESASSTMLVGTHFWR